ncbi:hypothetical protein EW026_g4716 [Hermanssonia centrifuga]|uniref:Amidase domain-containing protein n=1 Tax=Hermanssonia centrifuga TaxID=98765 RepID=A0A4S4KKS0_9APHY|nr:hypothetical protein EW026_g4716 [Hermanssonia centrifuga]
MWPSSSARSWQDIVRQKQTARTEALKTASTPVDSHIVYLSASAPEIPRRIASGEWTASEVLEAYISQAAVAHASTNCITEVLFEEARREAQALDQYFQEQKQLKGPLHGVPVSFKDLFNIKGCDSTVGHTQNADRPASTDAEVVKLVRQAGGIPLAKTNISQCMMFFDQNYGPAPLPFRAHELPERLKFGYYTSG